MFEYILNIFRKPLPINFVNKKLRSEGIETHFKNENILSFNLCDSDWDLFCDEKRFGLSQSYKIDDDLDKECVLKAANKINSQKWITKVYITESSNYGDEGKNDKEPLPFIVFIFDGFYDSKSQFMDLYEYAKFAIIDAYNHFWTDYYGFLNLKEKESENSTHP